MALFVRLFVLCAALGLALAPALSAEEAARDRQAAVGPGAAYPRPGAPVPSFAPTAEPAAVVPSGTVVMLWDAPGAPLSKDAQAVRHALSAMGIPWQALSGDLAAAQLSGASVLVLTGDLTAPNVSDAAAAALERALRAGAAALLVAPASTRLYALAGLSGGSYAVTRRELRLVPGASDGSTAELRALGVGNLRLAAFGYELPSRGYGVSAGDVQVLGRFEDGSAALLKRGRLYVLGLRAQYYTNLLSGGRYGLPGTDANSHYLEGDMLPLLLRGFYRGVAARPQLRVTAPAGRRAAVVLTHDTDSSNAAAYISQFLEVERAFGVRATYLVPTTPYGPNLGQVYKDELLTVLAAAVREGHEVGSHSFGHYPDFAQFPRRVLAENESAASYLPELTGDLTSEGSVFGELQVSRWLLQTDLGIEVQSFRSGHLQYPGSLPEDLRVAGYRRDSSRSVGVVRSNFPFRALRAVSGGYLVSPVIEYPLAISDHTLDSSNVAAVVAGWLALVDRNLITGAPTVLLLHSTSRAGKAEALRAFLTGLQRRDVWVGSLRELGSFYEAQGF